MHLKLTYYILNSGNKADIDYNENAETSKI